MKVGTFTFLPDVAEVPAMRQHCDEPVVSGRAIDMPRFGSFPTCPQFNASPGAERFFEIL